MESEVGVFCNVAGSDDEVEQVGRAASCRFFQTCSGTLYLQPRRGGRSGWGSDIIDKPKFCFFKCLLPSPQPCLLLRQQGLSLRELPRSHRVKHCPRGERGGISAAFPVFNFLHRHTGKCDYPNRCLYFRPEGRGLMAHYDKAAQPQQRRDVLTDTLALKKALLGAVLTALAAMPRTFPPPCPLPPRASPYRGGGFSRQ